MGGDHASVHDVHVGVGNKALVDFIALVGVLAHDLLAFVPIDFATKRQDTGAFQSVPPHRIVAMTAAVSARRMREPKDMGVASFNNLARSLGVKPPSGPIMTAHDCVFKCATEDGKPFIDLSRCDPQDFKTQSCAVISSAK